MARFVVIPGFVVFFLCATPLWAADLAGYEYFGDDNPPIELADKNQESMEKTLDSQEWSAAKTAYSNAADSEISLQVMSTDAEQTFPSSPFYNLFRTFFENPKYGDRFVTDAIDGNGDFASDKIKLDDPDAAWKGECGNKGSQYLNTWMYVVGNVDLAIKECSGDSLDNAWAAYVGSIVRDDSTGGFFTYTLATKRAADFDTPTTGTATVNTKVLDEFNNLRESIKSGCSGDMVSPRNEIVKQMIVPLMQGLLRYVIKAAKSDEEDELPKSQAEGWAFAYSILPFVNICSKDTAKKLIKNFHPRNEPMKSDSVKDLGRALQNIYGCLGFKCEDVGTNDDSDVGRGSCRGSESECLPKCSNKDGEFLKGEVPGVDKQEGAEIADFEDLPKYSSLDKDSTTTGTGGKGSKKGGLGTGAIVGIVIGVIAVLLIIIAILFWRRRKSSANKQGPSIQALDQNLDSSA